jgi:septum site-determining protein MinC
VPETKSATRPFIRVRGRSFVALVVAPEPPVELWLETLQAQIARAPSFFESRPVVSDLTAMPGAGQDLTRFIEHLQDHALRIIGVEGYDDGWSNVNAWGRPPLLGTAKIDRSVIVPEDDAPAPPEPPPPNSLLIREPVRSGQSVVFEHGDVSILGSIGSGAEVIAAGSIHVYGALRGRAIAGFTGNAAARIFCRRLDAELLAIDGVYKTADDTDPALRNKPAQAWLDGETLKLAAL